MFALMGRRFSINVKKLYQRRRSSRSKAGEADKGFGSNLKLGLWPTNCFVREFMKQVQNQQGSCYLY